MGEVGRGGGQMRPAFFFSLSLSLEVSGMCWRTLGRGEKTMLGTSRRAGSQVPSQRVTGIHSAVRQAKDSSIMAGGEREEGD